jgi:hypothetical protein
MVATNFREYAIFFVIAAFIVGLSVLRRSGSAGAAKQRAQVLPQMGFVESTREQVFGLHFRAIDHAIDGTGLSHLSHTVCKGSSALGETVIFDLADYSGGAAQDSSCTVIGFRVGGPIPYFSIAYEDRLNRLVQNTFDKATGSSEGVTPAGEPLFRVPLISAEKPDVAERYRVLASDLDGMQRAVTPAFTDALSRIDGHKLNISKWGTEWLFFYRRNIHPLAPQDYPALLQEAVGLLSLLDLNAAKAPH